MLHSVTLYGQRTLDSVLSKTNPDKLLACVEKRLSRLETKITSQGAKVLERLLKQEEKIYEKQSTAKDSLEGRLKLLAVQRKYNSIAEKLRDPLSLIASNIREYIPHLDTVSSVLNFLKQNDATANLKETISKIESFNEKLQRAHVINEFICERREILRHELERLHLIKELKRFSKETYYYHEQIKEYKALVSDPRRIEKKVIGLLIKTQAFRDFFRKNSLLASLFSLPRDSDDPGCLASLPGLQTRAEVNNLIQQQFGLSGPGGHAQFQQNVQQAQSQLNQVKEGILKNSPLGAVDNRADDIMPKGFKPNNQKTKSVLSRLEYSANIQAERATNFFPATTDLGLSIGFKLNDKSIIGIGASYKAGLGKGWNHLELSSQGAGLRSFIDWKLKGSIWISGGYEMNYKSQLKGVQISSPRGGDQEATGWQQSGLIGLSKVMDVKSTLFKKTKLQLFWDFLSCQQVPGTHAVVFRICYNLK